MNRSLFPVVVGLSVGCSGAGGSSSVPRAVADSWPAKWCQAAPGNTKEQLIGIMGAPTGVARTGGEHDRDAEPELAVVGRPAQRGQRRVRGRVGQCADGGGDPAVLLVDVREAPPAAARALAYPSSHAVGEVRCQSTSRECHGADRSDPVGETRDPAARGASQGPSNA